MAKKRLSVGTTLEQLAVGQRFVVPLTGRHGTLLRVGLMGCMVRYEGANHRRIEREGGAVEFDTPNGPTMIGGSTEVEAHA
jgi:hypothetical protein